MSTWFYSGSTFFCRIIHLPIPQCIQEPNDVSNPTTFNYNFPFCHPDSKYLHITKCKTFFVFFSVTPDNPKFTKPKNRSSKHQSKNGEKTEKNGEKQRKNGSKITSPTPCFVLKTPMVEGSNRCQKRIQVDPTEPKTGVYLDMIWPFSTPSLHLLPCKATKNKVT